MDIDATLTKAKQNTKSPLVHSLSVPRMCIDNQEEMETDPQDSSCEIGPVVRLSIAMDQDLDNTSRGIVKNDQRGRRAFLSVREKTSHSRSRSANNISRNTS